MRFEEIDKNMAINNVDEQGSLYDIYTIPDKNFDLYGVSYDDNIKAFTRFDNNIAKQISEPVEYLSRLTTGGRIRFTTNSHKVKLIVKWKTKQKMAQMSSFGSSGFTLVQNYEDGKYQLAGVFIPQYDADEGFESWIAIRDENRKNKDDIIHYTLFMPLYNEVKELYIGLEKGSIVKGGLKYRDIDPILFYGSSITQGGCASRADNSYENYISKWANLDYINIGLAGRCKGEQIMCDYLSNIKCSLFVLDYDHNAPTLEHLKDTHYNVYDTFRKKQPNTPILIISKPDYYSFPKTCKSKERLNVIKETYNRAVANGDKNVYFIDGRKLIPKSSYDDCFIEGTHPNDLGFYYMAKTILKEIKKILKF